MPQQLWIDHKENLSEDIILHQARIQEQDLGLSYNDFIFNKALIIIEDKIKSLGASDLKSFGLPESNLNQDAQLSSEMLEVLN